MAVNREEFLKVFDETIGNREEDEELLQSYEEDAKAFLPKLQTNNFPLYGLIGEYGTGKSTFLNAVRYYDQQNKETNNIRITFEARKYPNRKELWDAFIIEVLSQIIDEVINKDKENNQEKIFNIMNQIKKQMLGGEYNKNDKTIGKSNKVIEKISKFFKKLGEILSSCGSLIWNTETKLIGEGSKVIGDIISLTITKSKEGVSRIFDYEYFFAEYRKEIISKYFDGFDKVYIIIEDIDRCGDDGLIFLETLSYFMNTISKEKENMDKITCIVSIGNGFLNDHRHLINKAITSYEIFNMKTASISKYFHTAFLKEELGFSDTQREVLNEFINFYLDIHGSYTKSIREIKYLFKKIIPEIIQKKRLLENEGIQISDDVMLGMILYNFSLFVRGNKAEQSNGKFSNEIFDTTKSLYYCRFFSNQRGAYLYVPYIDQITTTYDFGGLGHFHESIFGKIFTIPPIKLADYKKYYTLVDNKEKGIEGIIEGSNNTNSKYTLCVSSYRLLNS